VLYGTASLEVIVADLDVQAQGAGHQLIHHQSNAEHELIGYIQGAPEQDIRFLLINPGAFTHTSIAMRDALLAVKLPFIEIHLSNVFAREDFRQHSYFSDIAQGVISGLGAYSYHLALMATIQILDTEQ